eukprot:m.50469 g.50469  ORF g.50469 m.50469 type:complete len:372 (+) comp34073_c0_seq4:605-1720(+)
MATEFNLLTFNVTQCQGFQYIRTIQPRVANIERNLFDTLETMFNTSLASNDHHRLRQCLRTYAIINKREVVETLFRDSLVRPFMEKAIRSSALSSHPRGLEGIYERALEFISSCCVMILDLTCLPGSHARLRHREGDVEHAALVQGYDFLVNAVWPEMVDLVESELAEIFAPGDPDAFHENYLTSMAFLSSFESQCRSRESLERLRKHSSYRSFMNKWSLPVYFQLRLQEIGGYFETSLDNPLEKSKEGLTFHLNVTSTLWKCLQSCWSSDIFLQALAHRFWKLTLQLLSRFITWIRDLTSTVSLKDVSIESSILLVTDIGLLEAEAWHHAMLTETNTFHIASILLCRFGFAQAGLYGRSSPGFCQRGLHS